MDKLKHILNPGKEKDDEVLYGTGQSDDPVLSGSPSGVPSQSSRHEETGKGTGPSPAHTNYSSGSTSAAPHSSHLGNKADPRVDSDPESSRGNREFTTLSQTPGHAQTRAEPSSSKPVAAGYATSTSPLSGSSASPSSTDRNKPLPQTPASFTGAPGTGAVAGRERSDRDLSSGYEDSATAGHAGGPGRSRREQPLGTSGVATGATHTHGRHQQEPATTDRVSSTRVGHTPAGGNSYEPNNSSIDPSQTRTGLGQNHGSTDAPGVLGASVLGRPRGTGYADTQQPFNETSGTSSTHYQTTRDVVPGTGPAGAETLAQGYPSHRDQAPRDPNPSGRTRGYSGTDPSGAGSSFFGAPQGTAVSSGATFSQGPHATQTANRLDPRLNQPGSNVRSGSGPSPEDATYGTSHGFTESETTKPSTGSSMGTAGPKKTHVVSQMHPDADTKRNVSNTTYSSPGTGGNKDFDAKPTVTEGSTSKSTGPAPSSGGPHKSSLMNTMDPRVDSDMDGSKTIGSVPGTEGNKETVREPIVTEQHSPHSSSTGPASSTAGPHKSNVLNKLDPRVDSDLDGSKTVGSSSGTGDRSPSSASTNPYSSVPVDPRIDSKPRASGTTPSGYKASTEDANRSPGRHVVGGGAYETDHRHEGSNVPPQETSRSSGRTQVTSEADSKNKSHVAERGAFAGAGVTGAGIAAREADKRHQPPPATHETSTPRAARSDPASGYAGSSSYSPTATTSPPGPNRTVQPTGAIDPVSTKSGSADVNRDQRDHRHGRDAAVGGGLAAGGALADHEVSRQDVQREEKQRNKELEKDHKRQQKEIEKEEKQHEKAVQREEKHHQKNAEKHHKEEKKDDKGHHGLLGFLHRDKDKQSSDEDPKHHGDTTTAAGTGAATGAYPAEKDYEREKQVERDEKHHQKDVDRAEKQHWKSNEKEDKHHKKDGKEEKKDHHGLLGGLLHRDKDKEDRESNTAPQQVANSPETGPNAVESSRLDESGYGHDHKERNRLHKDPPPGYAPSGPSDMVTEPVTGLPMDVNKYGSGAGGTDGGPVPGYQPRQ
ncbi:MAG: hypothetical protein M1833_002046 [Piccolia ochrophora]|nr:MAG: hypothetical protein M1833_002046 [Piccolia ochrophora]